MRLIQNNPNARVPYEPEGRASMGSPDSAMLVVANQRYLLQWPLLISTSSMGKEISLSQSNTSSCLFLRAHFAWDNLC